ncbi:hypothetical protein M427DRAFT_472347 [Gonapodya prolifera JEL478]|uniref:Uncharacterized protein n=1 Tax=Gonapodya prolifera (strain JEL478) TaxID=1344416 RepID=A0A139AR60_GONPJ|nr:hypothetical protein M427DRAFT_472347 [Gonapodya prolifera JEL478]|eukprot:KXS19241.1 hypothetical protein M427DRAFT_472347 [Gonapodya prolifera JEL478]
MCSVFGCEKGSTSRSMRTATFTTRGPLFCRKIQTLGQCLPCNLQSSRQIMSITTVAQSLTDLGDRSCASLRS